MKSKTFTKINPLKRLCPQCKIKLPKRKRIYCSKECRRKHYKSMKKLFRKIGVKK